MGAYYSDHGHEFMSVKWVYKMRTNQDGKVEKYKTRLIAKDYIESIRRS